MFTFVESASDMALSEWVEGYTASDCPAFAIDAAVNLRAIYDTLQLEAFTSGAPEDECQPQTIITTLGEAVAGNTVDVWQEDYSSAACPEFVMENVDALARVYETASLSYAPAGVGSVSYEGDAIILQTVSPEGIVENWVVSTLENNKSSYTSQAILDGINGADIAYFAVRLEGVDNYAIIPFNVFRAAERISEDLYAFTVPDSSTIRGAFDTISVADAAENSFSPRSRETIVLITLPSDMEDSIPFVSDGIWQLSVNDQTFTVAQPRFALSASRTRANCIGACGYTGYFNHLGLSMQIDGNDEVTQAAFDTLARVTFDLEGRVSVTLPNQYELGGTLVLDSRQRSIYLVADVVNDDTGAYLYTVMIGLSEENYPVTLEKAIEEE